MKTTPSPLCLALFLCQSLTLVAAAPRHVDVFVSGQDGYHAYRIPAIETAADGSLLAFAEARKHNLNDPGFEGADIDLVMKRSTDRGETWSPMKLIEDAGELWSAANPATVVDRENGRVWLFYLRCKPGRNTDTAQARTDDIQTLARYSDDHGVTWSAPVDLTDVARDMDDAQWRSSVMGPGGAVQDPQGRLLVPFWKVAPPGVFAIMSEDHGRTWQRGQVMPGTLGVDENQLAVLSDGQILMDVRQSSGPNRWMTTSRDGGRTWSEPRPGEQVTPVACAIERYLQEREGQKRPCLLWTGPKGPGRKNLVLRVSYDEGKSFKEEHPIYEGEAAYSDLTILKDSSIGILWERGQERGYQFITFTRVTPEQLRAPH